MIREIDISKQARRLRILRVVDYVFVILCGQFLLGILSAASRAAGDEPGAVRIAVLVAVAVLGFAVYTGYRHVGVIDARVWRTDVISLPILAVIFLTAAAFLGLVGLVDYLNGREFKDEQLLALMSAVYFFWVAVVACAAFVSVLLLKRSRVAPVDLPLVEFLSRLRRGSGRRAGDAERIDAPRGIALGAGAIAIFLFLVLIPVDRPNIIFHFLFLLSLYLLLRARMCFQVDADSLLAVDKRRPILFLRSFDDDTKAEYSKVNKVILDFSLETRLSNHFSHFGPFIAVGDPYETTPQIGAARAHLSEQEWQTKVVGWISEANIIVLYAGTSRWINWELEKVIDMGQAEKLILLIPEVKAKDKAGRTQEVSARLGRVRGIIKNTSWAGAVTALRDGPDIRALVFEPDESLTVMRSGLGNRDSYHLAALVAHYLIVNRTPTSVA
jgi:hypothetical protein